MPYNNKTNNVVLCFMVFYCVSISVSRFVPETYLGTQKFHMLHVVPVAPCLHSMDKQYRLSPTLNPRFVCLVLAVLNTENQPGCQSPHHTGSGVL